MPERDNAALSKAEQKKQEILTYVENIKFGTTEYEAFCDYMEHEELTDDILILRRNVSNNADNPASKLYWESELRITETRQSLLEREVSKNKSRIIGYARAYNFIDFGFRDLEERVSDEAKEKYPSDERARYHVYYENYERPQSIARDKMYRLQE